jgi:hypothetical protein
MNNFANIHLHSISRPRSFKKTQSNKKYFIFSSSVVAKSKSTEENILVCFAASATHPEIILATLAASATQPEIILAAQVASNNNHFIKFLNTMEKPMIKLRYEMLRNEAHVQYHSEFQDVAVRYLSAVHYAISRALPISLRYAISRALTHTVIHI